MKKTLILLLISLVAAAATDVSFAARSMPMSIAVAAFVYFLATFLFYNRIAEKRLVNSLLLFFFMLVLVSLAFKVNPAAWYLWLSVSGAAVAGYIAGLGAKWMQMRRGLSAN